MWGAVKRSLPDFPAPIWLLSGGRLLSQIGNGFVLFSAPIFFVNQVGLSTTEVGIALGSASVSGILGRFWGGSLTDSPRFGRKKTVLLSALVSAIADVVFVGTHSFSLLVWGNLLMGLGIAFYWPAVETMVADYTNEQNRNEAFAINRLADNLGLGLGVILGGRWATYGADFRWLFVLDGISFMVFFALVYAFVAEPTPAPVAADHGGNQWLQTFRDRSLWVFLVVNVMFTTYLSQVQSVIPLYFSNYVTNSHHPQGFSPDLVSLLFTWQIVCATVLQMPIARALKKLNHTKALRFSLLHWGLGFGLIWAVGQGFSWAVGLGAIALGVLSIAMVAYTPAASSLVVEMAPLSLRGAYLSLNSQCWAIGYLVGPTLGGWILDQPLAVIHGYWWVLAGSVVPGLMVVNTLEKMLAPRSKGAVSP